MITDYNLIVQHMSDALVLLDADGYIRFANPAVENITGFSPEQLVDQHLSVFYNHDTIKTEYEISLARKKDRFVSEGWRSRALGPQFWCEMTFSRIKQNEITVGFTCLFRDLTSRKQSELELRNSEERFRLMVEGVRDYAIFLLDPRGHIFTWNEGAKRLKGYAAEEIIGKHFSTFYIAEDLESKKPERELEIAIRTGKYEEVGWRVKKDGSLFWANVVITALFNTENKLVGFSKVTRDLTERKSHEENLRQSEERYRSLVEQVTDYGIFMLDEAGRIISWNEGARRLKGYEASEIIGKYFSIFYIEEDIIKGKPAHELKVARATGKYEEEGWRMRKDGSLFWANVVITAVFNTEGILIGYSKVTRDLTERKEAERALREAHDRYRALANQLGVTNRELKAANEELEQFTSIVSHDLQEPIRTIKSFLQLIELKLKEGEPQNLNSYINKSINAANRMRELIQNLLNYSQLSKVEADKECINVYDLFDQVTQNLKTAIDTVEAQVTIESDVDAVWGDRVQLAQLLQNLLSNALKFTSKTTPLVKVSCVKQADGSVAFSVQDNGIGIAEQDKEKIYEIFRRLNTPKEYPGTGIGLAICKKIVDRHGGAIWSESQPGIGTTFHFTLDQKIKEGVLAE